MSKGTSLQLQVVTPLFTGKTLDKTIMEKRKAAWFDYEHSPAHETLKRACEVVSISPYFPGNVMFIPHKTHQDAVKLVLPRRTAARVPKGFVARLHLLVLLERVSRAGTDPKNVVFACIDGSGAFKFESLKLLVDSFAKNPDVDVVFGKRPDKNSGMPSGRKEIEEFEQFLLFQHRLRELKHTFSGFDLDEGLLPDGQAGCWGFRLSAAERLPLTASGYEIEFDLLTSALDAGLRAAYTKPLQMSVGNRHSSASAAAIEMSINKLNFIESKLRIKHVDVVKGWHAFKKQFASSKILAAIPPGYEKALLEHCDSLV